MKEECNVKLISKEGEEFCVPWDVACMSQLVADTLADDDDDEDVREIPLPNVKAAVLSKVLDYCKHYQVEPMSEIVTPLTSSLLEGLVQPWYTKFCVVEQTMLFELVTAANFMNIKSLLDLTCLAVAVSIKGKPEDELRLMFNISKDLSPEEEAQIAQENSWAEQPVSQAEQPDEQAE